MITVNGNDLEWHEGMTISLVLEKMDYTALTLITVFVDGIFVPPEDYTSHVLDDGAEVKAMHLHHGG
jgi:thiamine biosynthesis protein ThiS